MILTAFLSLVSRARGAPQQINTDTSSPVRYVDVTATANGSLAAWSTDANQIAARRWEGVNEIEVVKANSASVKYLAIDCDQNECMFAWQHLFQIYSIYFELIPGGVSVPILALFPSDSIDTERPPVVACKGSDCTVGTFSYVSGEAYSYKSGREQTETFFISGVKTDLLTALKAQSYGTGQIWLYVKTPNNVVTVGRRSAPNGAFDQEFPISESSSTPRERLQVDCLSSGICAASWTENAGRNPRWRLFSVNGSMISDIIRGIVPLELLPNDLSVIGVVITKTHMLRLWQRKVSNFRFYLRGQWLDLEGTLDGDAFTVATTATYVPFSASRHFDQVRVVWADGNKVMGDFVSPPLSTTTPLVTMTLPTTVSMAGPTPLSIATMSSETTPPPSSKFSTMTKVASSALRATIASTFFSNDLSSSTIESSAVFETTPITTYSKKISISQHRLSSSTFSGRVSQATPSGSGLSLGAIVGIVAGVACSVFTTVGVVWCALLRRREEPESEIGLDDMDLESESENHYQFLALAPTPQGTESASGNYALAPHPANAQYGAAPPARESQYDQVDDELFA